MYCFFGTDINLKCVYNIELNILSISETQDLVNIKFKKQDGK